MVPSNERFQSNDPAIARIDFRLIMQHELVLVEGTAKFFDCFVALGGIDYSIHLDPGEVIPCLPWRPSRSKFHLDILNLLPCCIGDLRLEFRKRFDAYGAARQA
jgi:hypothetical protein